MVSVSLSLFFLMIRPPPRTNLFPYTTLFRSLQEFTRCSSAMRLARFQCTAGGGPIGCACANAVVVPNEERRAVGVRSEEHTSELQSRSDLVCRLLLEKKKSDVCHTSYTQHLT